MTSCVFDTFLFQEHQNAEQVSVKDDLKKGKLTRQGHKLKETSVKLQPKLRAKTKSNTWIQDPQNSIKDEKDKSEGHLTQEGGRINPTSN